MKMKFVCELELVASAEQIRANPQHWRFNSTFFSTYEIDAVNPQDALDLIVHRQDSLASGYEGRLEPTYNWVYKGLAYRSPLKKSTKPLAIFESFEAQQHREREFQRELRRAYSPSR
ncbi:MAG: hypothetical protein HY367_03290 [Candidatus Aenigmarchaeota archaeon]|nr:hypothetical protein [Candidatus Aenigmarchaeota archaeon]